MGVVHRPYRRLGLASQVAAAAMQPDEPAGKWRIGLVTGAAFLLYLASAIALQARGATALFGADTGLYVWMAQGNAADRITRFHPLTTALIMGWMKLLAPVTGWLGTAVVLKSLFAAIGAVGVWAAMRAFAAVMPGSYVPFFGVIYATSLGPWYFASIEESKIVSAALTALYLATYLHMRTRWTLARAAMLSGILLLACLNEIVAGFLVLVPLIDALWQRGVDFRRDGWIIPHGLVAPAALAFLELVVNGRLTRVSSDPEQASHLSMLLYYLADNDFSWSTTTGFLANWLLFNIAAPSNAATHAYDQWPAYHAFFVPGFGSYLASPWGAAVALAAGVLASASLGPLVKSGSHGLARGLIAGLVAFVVVRATFFYLFNPNECLLFSPSVTIPHLMLIGVPFVASALPYKMAFLGLGGLMLFINNAIFIFGL